MLFLSLIDENLPLVGIEPSAILGFRDEYPDLVNSELREKSKKIAGNSFMIDEFIANEFRAGRIKQRVIHRQIIFRSYLHAHCQQKAVSSSACSIEMLSIPDEL